MRLVIVGGGAAGATAAQFARKQSRDAEILLVEQSGRPQYSRCGLPHALSGEIPAFQDLVEFSEDWFSRNRIDLRLRTRAESVDHKARKIVLAGQSGEATESYDSIILATGSSPSIPKIAGLPADGRLPSGAFTFKDMDDAMRIKDWCASGKRRAVVVGAGLVGLEVAEALRRLDNEVVVVEYLDSILPAMVDQDIAEPLLGALSSHGIKILTSSTVSKIIGGESVNGVQVTRRSDGAQEEVECDTLVLAAGQRPSSPLAASAGCALGEGGHVKVDKGCRTSVDGMFAIGDCSEYVDAVTRDPLPVGMGTLAVKMGEIAGKNAAGAAESLPDGFLNTRVTKIFGSEIAAAGPTTKALSDSGIRFIQARVKGSTLPAYYPGGKELTVKLTASESGKLLSCQISGEKEAAMRADIVAACIASGASVKDLSMLETAYAPPVAPCVDVLAIACQALLIKLSRTRQ